MTRRDDCTRNSSLLLLLFFPSVIFLPSPFNQHRQQHSTQCRNRALITQSGTGPKATNCLQLIQDNRSNAAAGQLLELQRHHSTDTSLRCLCLKQPPIDYRTLGQQTTHQHINGTLHVTQVRTSSLQRSAASQHAHRPGNDRAEARHLQRRYERTTTPARMSHARCSIASLPADHQVTSINQHHRENCISSSLDGARAASFMGVHSHMYKTLKHKNTHSRQAGPTSPQHSREPSSLSRGPRSKNADK